MESASVWKQPHKSSHYSTVSKEDAVTAAAGNAASIPGSSAWGALKSSTSQNQVQGGSSAGGWALADKEASKLPVSESCWSVKTGSQPSVASGQWDNNPPGSTGASDTTWGATGDEKSSASGWGSPDGNPLPNSGTENWSHQSSSMSRASDTGRCSVWGSNSKTATANTCGWGASEGKAGLNEVWGHSLTQHENAWNMQADNDGTPVAASHSEISRCSSWENNKPASAAGSKQETSQWSGANVQSSPATSQTSSQSTWAEAAGRGVTTNDPGKSSDDGNCTNAQLARDEMIARAINSLEGWGKTPIRQDTVWDVGGGGGELSASSVVAKTVEETAIKHAPSSSNGTAIWEASKENLPVPSTNHVDSRGVLIPSNCSAVRCNENTPSGWGFAGAVGDKNVPSQQQAVSAAGSWNLPAEQKGLQIGSIWNSNNGTGLADDISRQHLAAGSTSGIGSGMSRTHVSGILDSIENVQSVASVPWTGSLFTDTKVAVDSVANSSCHPWNNSILNSSTVSSPLSSSSSAPFTASSLNVVTDIWSSPDTQTILNRSSSSWGDSSNDSIWNPISLVSHICLNVFDDLEFYIYLLIILDVYKIAAKLVVQNIFGFLSYRFFNILKM